MVLMASALAAPVYGIVVAVAVVAPPVLSTIVALLGLTAAVKAVVEAVVVTAGADTGMVTVTTAGPPVGPQTLQTLVTASKTNEALAETEPLPN